MEKKQGNFLVILVMILLFGMISFVTNLASPMGDILKNQFSVANWMGTLGVLANFIAYAVMGIPAGNMLQKIRLQENSFDCCSSRFHRRWHSNTFRSHRQQHCFRYLPPRCFHRWFLNVYVEHRC